VPVRWARSPGATPQAPEFSRRASGHG